MKELTSEQIDNTQIAAEDNQTTAQKSKPSSAKKPAATKKARPTDVMDALAKVREEERQKLEALREREREKTRLAVEKERARLEAELAKEINALENQLGKERSSLLKEAVTRPIELVEVETASVKPSTSVKTASVKKAAAEKKTTKTAATKKTTTKKTATKKAAGTKATTKKTTTKKATTKKTVAKTKEAALETTSSKLVKKVEPIVETVVGPIELEPVQNVVGPIELEPVQNIVEQEVPPVQNEVEPLTTPVSVEDAEILVSEEKVMEKLQPEVILENQENVTMKENEELMSIQDQKEELQTEEKVVQEETVEATPEKDVEPPVSIAPSKEPSTVINSLDKLREKIYAQKQLEKEILEKEAAKIQEKDKQLLEKLNNIDQDAAVIAEMDDLKKAQQQIDNLIQENEEQLQRLNELEGIVNKVKALKINNITIIDEKTFEISNDFLEISKENIDVNTAILEIEKEFDSLSKAHHDTIEKLKASEKEVRDSKLELSELKLAVAEKEKLYQDALKNSSNFVQEKQELEHKIEILNQVILRSEEKISEEKENHQGYLYQIETLESEKRRLNKQISNLEAEVYMLNEKLEKRIHSSINTAARLDALEAEKDALEAEILSLNKKLAFRNNFKPELEEEFVQRYSERKDLNNHQVNNGSEELRSSESEQQPSLEEFVCPYHRFFNPELVPNTAKEPQVLNQDLAQELLKLRNEIQELKDVKEVAEPVVEPSVSLDSKPDSVDNTTIEPHVEVEQPKEEYLQELENLQDKLDQHQKELEEKAEEIEKLTKTFESQIREKENEKEMVKTEKDRIIQELEKQIQEKDNLIQKAHDELQRLTEDDIFDPEFKRKIRVVRQMKRETLEKAEKEEKNHQEAVQSLKEKIDAKHLEIDLINDKLFQLEMNYKQNRDFSAAAQDEYEKTKSKYLIERQLQEERQRDLEDELTRLNFKFDASQNTKDTEIEKLEAEETQLIEHYLNKLKNKKTRDLLHLQKTENERDDLIEQLEEIKKEDEIEIVDDYHAPAGTYLTKDREKLENEIRELTRQYNEYYRQITELKAEQDKRIEVEKQLRTQNKTVYEYCSIKVNLDEALKTYQEKSKLIEEKEERLAQTSSRPEDRTEQLKLKAEIQDLEVHRNDLRAKIDFYRKKCTELENEEIVEKYKSLRMQMEKIRSIQRDKREQAETIKTEVQNKTKELENLRV